MVYPSVIAIWQSEFPLLLHGRISGPDLAPRSATATGTATGDWRLAAGANRKLASSFTTVSTQKGSLRPHQSENLAFNGSLLYYTCSVGMMTKSGSPMRIALVEPDRRTLQDDPTL